MFEYLYELESEISELQQQNAGDADDVSNSNFMSRHEKPKGEKKEEISSLP